MMRWCCCPAFLTLALALNLTSLAGCSRGGRAAVYPAEGQVVLDGKPLAGAQVVFYPQGTKDGETIPSRAQTDEQGRYRLSTYEKEDGAPEGQYDVTVVHYRARQDGSGFVPGPNALPTKYASPKTTDLHVTVSRDTTSLQPIVLQTPKDPKKTRRS